MLQVVNEIQVAFVFGSIASQAETVDSDVDALIISDGLAYGNVFTLLENAATSLCRKVNPVIYSRAEFAKRVKSSGGFIKKVLLLPNIWLLKNGAENVVLYPSNTQILFSKLGGQMGGGGVLYEQLSMKSEA